ncbi:MAG TPA: class I SAM-dependent methyltransferase [Steroidobacteraceae bacterium]|nr:class I SAM-dependent methyltransferase [Steroidobacteraceae bacterium]
MQDKRNEIAFFNAHAASDDYNVFSESANARLIDSFVRLTRLDPGARVIDLGCGSGIFTYLLSRRGYRVSGLDISPKLLELARAKYPGLQFDEGDVEALPYEDASVDGVLLSGIVHHLPDVKPCATEVMRVLKPKGRFVAFDPNRANPFMYLYRDPSSPFYSSVGVTVNERPICARAAAAAFRAAGLEVGTDYLSRLPYRYVASPIARVGLSIYNFIDNWMFRPGFMKPHSAFVLTYGEKP